MEGTNEICSITYKELPHDVQPGGRIMLDDGLISLRIEHVTDTDIVCTVENDGVIKTKKGVNVPGVHLSMPYMSQRDKQDILFGIEQGFDIISASFTPAARPIFWKSATCWTSTTPISKSSQRLKIRRASITLRKSLV